MNGCVIPHTPIAVDFWKIRECPQARIFFLTHLHGDHITGLTSSWNYPIYCSEVTGKLLVQRYGVKEDLIHALQIDCAKIIYLDEEYREQMTVTAIDANHCPGAVMFLMEGYFGTILHTGDFRFHSEMIPHSVLSKYSGKVDVLYLDNTYCSPDCVFPTREEVTSNIIAIIEQHPEHDVLIAMRNLGKEDLLCKIAMHFHEWISVPDKFYKTLEILGAPEVFDNSSMEQRIRVVPFHKVSNKFVNKVNEEQQTIVILPTALYHGIEAQPYENNNKVFVVPYSDHSSFTELRNFVSFIKPKKIIPVVKSNSRGPFGLSIADRADMTVFADCVTGDWTINIEIPVSVQAFMHPKNHKLLGIEKRGLKRKAKVKVSQVKKVKRGVTYDSPKFAFRKHFKSKGEISSESGNENEKENQVRKNGRLAVKRNLFDKRSIEFDIHPDGKTFGAMEDVDIGNLTETDKEIAENRDIPQRRHEAKVESQSNSKSKIGVKNIKKKSGLGSSISGSKGGNVILRKEHKEMDSEIPELFKNNSKTYAKKKTGLKMPLHSATSERDSRFDTVVGMKTYSKSCSKKFLSVKKVTLPVENEKVTKMKETAQWVLETLKHKFDYVTEEMVESIEVKGNDEKMDALEHNDKNICETENSNESLNRKAKASNDLRRSTLSKYFSAKNKPIFISDALTNKKEIYIAKKLNDLENRSDKLNLQTQYEQGDEEYISEEDYVDLTGSESDVDRLIVDDTETVEGKRGNKESENVEREHITEIADEKFECTHIVSDDSVIAQAGTQIQNSNASLKCNNLIEKKSIAVNYLDRIMKEIVEENSNESEFGEEHNVSVIAQVGTQVQNSSVNSKGCITMGNKSLAINCLNGIVTDKVDKISHEIEDGHNTSDESVVAQAGTQMNTCNNFTLNNLVRNDLMAINENSNEDRSVRNILEIKSPEMENKCESLENSLSIFVDEQSAATGIKTGSKDYSEETSLEVELPEQINVDFQNKFNQSKTSQYGKKFGKEKTISMIIGKNPENLEEKDIENADMSVFVNVGTQRDTRELESNDYSKVNDSITWVGEKTLRKGFRKIVPPKACRKYKVCCKQCELDAFRQAFKLLEKLDLKERSISLEKEKELKPKTFMAGLKPTGNSKRFKYEFKVKPVHQ